MDTTLIGIILALLSGLAAAPGPILIKKASTGIRKINDLFSITLFLGIATYAVSVLLSLTALRFGNLSVIGSIFSSVHIWVTIISIKFLKEDVKPKRMIGIGLVVLGIILIGSGL